MKKLLKYCILWGAAYYCINFVSYMFMFPILNTFGLRDMILDCSVYEKLCIPREWVRIVMIVFSIPLGKYFVDNY